MTTEHSPAAPFSAQEVAAFQKDDITAAGNIVKLMLGIFGVGIVLYLVVDFACGLTHFLSTM